MMPEQKEKMTSEDAVRLTAFITLIAAIPAGIWSYKSAEDLLGAIARFVTAELVIFFAVLFVIAFFKGLADPDENTETK